VNPLAQGLLLGPAFLYRGAVALRNRYYDRPSAVRKVSVPVVSVGNVTLGGTGKTPVVAWLAVQLGAMGRKPAIVSRGYGGVAGRGPVFVSRGDGPLCDAHQAGDEPVQLATGLPGVRVVVGSDRWAGAAAAAADGADVVVLDDGFQHRRLARDLDIVLIDASNPFGNEHVIPAGRLREPLHALGRAQVVLITRARPDTEYPRIESVVRRYRPDATILHAGHRSVGFVDADGRGVSPPARALAFCGIGNPSRFQVDLRELGVDVVAFRAFRDHHVYTGAELEELQRAARSRDAVLVTTDKDLVRIHAGDHGLPLSALLALRIEAVIHQPEPLLDALRGLDETGGPR
jgi:tetraacyldisaccharide 4'-kinase